VEGTEQAAPAAQAIGDGAGPEQISNRLKAEFPDDESMRISHEAIYQALFIEGRGALKRELAACCARAARCGSHGHDRGTSRKALSPQTL
jgi:IS30 family transposase